MRGTSWYRWVLREELGFIGVTVALARFLMLFLRITNIAERANESYSSW